MTSALLCYTPSDEETRHLLHEVSLRPSIWDSRIKFTERRPQIPLDWLIVSNAVGLCVEECKRRWKSLRNNYRAKIHRGNDSRWQHSKHMEFVRDVFPPHNPKTPKRMQRVDRVKERKLLPHPQKYLESVQSYSAFKKGGIEFEAEERLFLVTDEPPFGLDVDEEAIRLWGSDQWLRQTNLDALLPIYTAPPPSPVYEIPNESNLHFMLSMVPMLRSLSDQSKERFRRWTRRVLSDMLIAEQKLPINGEAAMNIL
ncbi:uncharacterized protein LOC117147162 [Drosophila mauritiana]|uniref:Uncharacterized protein LOC117147162 n=1 Tax=Drosophila mauritiana TaxID=7226 RepID=A0A6P8KJT7_DROMA|nr:uncharacterized protein LOC117147162 [Drosophila mauritiana]